MTNADPAALVVVDTNVLLAATDSDRAAHQAATVFLDTDQRRLALTPQIVREYLAVATRPVDANGLGLPPDDAIVNIEQLLADMELLPETTTTTRHLLHLLTQHPTAGKQVHDANLVAVALAHKAAAIVTDNTTHFTRFAGLIDIQALTLR